MGWALGKCGAGGSGGSWDSLGGGVLKRVTGGLGRRSWRVWVEEVSWRWYRWASDIMKSIDLRSNFQNEGCLVVIAMKSSRRLFL